MNARRVMGLGLAAAFLGLATASEAHAIPSFARVTGLTCNQCHVQFTPNPDFTWTGKKFRLNGYRLPWVQERLSAGEEGALNGRRLTLNLINYWSMGFEQTLLEQSKSPSNPSGPAAQTSPLASNPDANLTTFFSGPIGDHIGVWNEIYFTAASGGAENPFRFVAHDEIDLKLVFNPGGNILGFQVTTQPLATTMGFQFSSGEVSHEYRGGTAQAHAPRMTLSAYGLWKDRLLTVFSAQTGEDNVEWQAENANGDLERRMNFQALLAYAFLNQDAGEMWYMGWAKFGNDGVPMVTNVAVDRGTRAFRYSDAIRGISSMHANAPYLSEETGDFLRMRHQLEYGFIDRGPWSARAAVGVSINSEKYTDGAKIKENAWGANVRWNYDRTWEWQLGINKRFKHEFTDATGTVHKIPSDLGINARFHRRLAMNFVAFLVASNAQTLALNTDWRNGYSWEIGFDYYF